MPIVLAAAMALAASATALPVAPQPAAPGAYDLAPWWMDKPVIPSIGYVTTEVPANRAAVSATYEAVDRDVAEATRTAAQKARAISGSLESYGADRVRVETHFNITPLYEQYRDKNGEMINNQRADKIDRYQVAVQVSVEIRDVRLVEPVYAILMSAKPSRAEPVTFSLEPSDETRTQMFRLAAADARRRAELAATAAGSRVGAVRVIDPTARACETDVLLALAGRSDVEAVPVPVAAPPMMAPRADSLSELVVTARKRAQAAGLRPEDLQLPVHPPMQVLEGKACVVFSLSEAR